MFHVRTINKTLQIYRCNLATFIQLAKVQFGQIFVREEEVMLNKQTRQSKQKSTEVKT